MSPTPSDRSPCERFRMVDLFAGPGGLDLAAEILDVPSIGIEWDDDAVSTRQAAGLRTQHGDVRLFGPGDRRFADCNVLAGGPPCQTFSIAGSGTGRKALDLVTRFIHRMHDWYDREKAGLRGETWEDIQRELDELEDERTGLVLQPLRWVLEAMLRPRHGGDEPRPFDVIVLEQVPSVLQVWHEYEKVLRAVGYSTWARVFHTEQYGVPQTRRRAVLVARLGDRSAAEPAPTHQQYRKGVRPAELPLEGVRAPWISMADALREVYGHVAEATRRDLPFRVVSNYGSGGDPKARGRRDSNEPSATITGKWKRNRIVSTGTPEIDLDRLRNEEAGVLQSFPYRYPWRGSDPAQQIGNAVPPWFGAHVLSAALGFEVPGARLRERLLCWKPGETAPVPAAREEKVLTGHLG
ncbi:DNA cytosine methyltransferase [Streptomyces sp. SCSIO 75703]|uniref:DNA cytosine methyltransferase n=1 Tax=unclassified Streptomyces TaxID=2593676 RepID=UPI000B1FAB0E|nr:MULTISPECIES: DNA cytosine methyltransferase [unclassified Streptomyces]